MKRRLLFVHNHPMRFVSMDRELLSERYDLCEWYQRSRVVNLPALINAVAKSDLVFGWFASWHTLFPVLAARGLHRPVVLVVGGYDTANMPEIGYGSQRGGMKRWISRMAMHASTILITNSAYARDEVVRNAGIDQGRIQVVYHGLPVHACDVNRAKENLVITIGNVDRDNLERKGLAATVRVAAEIPEVPFSVIGAWRDGAINELRAMAPQNVSFTGWVDDRQLQDYLSRAAVYVQLSRHEAFGMSVAEAMLSQCVPVATRAGALPEVIGEAGFYVDTLDPQAVAAQILHALHADSSWGKRARERIIDEFPLERRRDKLYAILDQVLC